MVSLRKKMKKYNIGIWYLCCVIALGYFIIIISKC